MDFTEEEKIVLSAINYEELNILQVQTTLFLYDNAVCKFEEYEDFEFVSGCKGPYSDMVHWMLDDMVEIGMVEDGFNLTEKGMEEFVNFEVRFEKILYEFGNFIKGLDEDEILSFMLSSYPEYFMDDEEIERIRGKNIGCALSMFRRGKISEDKAVEIAGVGYKKFMGMLK